MDLMKVPDSKIKIQNAKDASATNSGPLEDLSKISIDPLS